jgi:dTDP-glucose 4,6-dehydratase/UDP-glucuronate decarboxylase
MDPDLVKDAEQVIDDLKDLNQRFSGKKILLTGAAGFLGSQFIHYFLRLNDSKTLKQPCKVFAWDNFLRGKPVWIDKLQGRPDLVCETRDITQKHDFDPVDFVVHAASIASPVYYRMHPIETMDANVGGLRHLLDHVVTQPVESFLFFSSSEIYGDPDPECIPTPETYRGSVSCTGPRACYDESKRYGETLCVNFWKAHQVRTKIVRPFNNYGPGLKITDRRVLPDFFRNILANENIVLLSDGTAQRTFCYIADAMAGYLRVMLSTHHGEPFNIGTEAPEISMRELAGLVIDISGKPLQVEFGRSEDECYVVDNPQRRCPSIAKARELVEYVPRVALSEGLERTYQYYLSNPDAPEA